MREVVFVRESDDLALATSHLAQSSSASRFDRAMVERAVGLGFTQERIAALLGITKPTLEKHFREELDRGGAVVEYQVGSSLVDQALKGSVNACALFLSRRAGWKETQVIESKAATDSMSEAELMQELADRANALGVKIDVSIGEQHPHALDRNHRSKRQRRG
jgi:hypothetical protein